MFEIFLAPLAFLFTLALIANMLLGQKPLAGKIMDWLLSFKKKEASPSGSKEKSLQQLIEDEDTLERPMPPELLEMDRKTAAKRRIFYNHPPVAYFIKGPRRERIPLKRYREAKMKQGIERFLLAYDRAL